MLARKNAVLVLMSIELMLNAVNINLVGFNAWFADQTASVRSSACSSSRSAAAEVGVGLAIVLLIFRRRKTINIDEVDLLKW